MEKIKTIFRLFAYFVLFASIFNSTVSLAAEKKELKFSIKLDEKSWIKKDLINLAGEMEQRAKVYRTTTQKAYWENEAKKTFFKYLRSEGYYDHAIEIEIIEESNTMIFNITLGKRYKIADISIDYAPKSNKDLHLLKLYKMGIKTGEYAIAQNILEAEAKLLEYLENKNCILTMSVVHEATIDHDNKVVRVKFVIDAGPNTTLEKVEFTGLKTIKAEFVRKLVKLKDGQCLKPSYINEARGNLQRSGLFSTTTPIIPSEVNKDGSVPIGFNLTERKPRSFKAGVEFATDTGLGIVLGWEHRNFFGSGELVKTEIKGNQKEQALSLDYTKPFFKRDDQTLKLGTKFENKILKAYATKEASISGSLEREFAPHWVGSVGTEFSRSFVKKLELDTPTNHNYSLFSTPLFLTHDVRDNMLDPKKGYFVKLDTQPYFSISSKEKPFVKTQISASTYFASKTKLLPVLAIRAASGTISGTGTRPVPETERFYVGGDKSLRGYAYQAASSLDANNNPIGGKSFVETSIELRLKMNSSVGVVGFLDSGFAFDSVKPQLNKKLLHGAGFGVRYLTTFGPLRFDIGFPLKRRKFVDKSAYQLYFGIGQSF